MVELYKSRQFFEETVYITSILFQNTQSNEYCEILAECHHQQGNYIEAVQFVN